MQFLSPRVKVFRTPLLVLLQIIESMLMLHPFYRNSTGCLLSTVVFSKNATLVHKFLHSGSPSYFEPFLSFNSCPYSSRRSHPDRQYLTVPPFHSSVFKSAKHFGHSFAFDAPKIWNDLPQDVRSSGRSLKHTCLQKPTHHSLPRHIHVSLVRPGYVP